MSVSVDLLNREINEKRMRIRRLVATFTGFCRLLGPIEEQFENYDVIEKLQMDPVLAYVEFKKLSRAADMQIRQYNMLTKTALEGNKVIYLDQTVMLDPSKRVYERSTIWENPYNLTSRVLDNFVSRFAQGDDVLVSVGKVSYLPKIENLFILPMEAYISESSVGSTFIQYLEKIEEDESDRIQLCLHQLRVIVSNIEVRSEDNLIINNTNESQYLIPYENEIQANSIVTAYSKNLTEERKRTLQKPGRVRGIEKDSRSEILDIINFVSNENYSSVVLDVEKYHLVPALVDSGINVVLKDYYGFKVTGDPGVVCWGFDVIGYASVRYEYVFREVRGGFYFPSCRYSECLILTVRALDVSRKFTLWDLRLRAFYMFQLYLLSFFSKSIYSYDPFLSWFRRPYFKASGYFRFLVQYTQTYDDMCRTCAAVSQESSHIQGVDWVLRDITNNLTSYRVWAGDPSCFKLVTYSHLSTIKF